MAGVLASMAVKLGLDKLSSFLHPWPTASSPSSLVMQDDLEDLSRLKRTMRRIRATLQDAEENWNIHEESAKLRLKELKEVAYDAEDVVDEYEYEVKLEALERSAGVQSSNNKRKRHERNGTNATDTGTVAILNKLVVRARQIMKRYDEIFKDYGNLALTENDGERRFAPDISSLREVGSHVCERNILGREHDKDNIVEKILPREDERIGNPISVLAIVGMGGLGKTTLAQLVYNDPRVRQSFDMLAWVCVSDQFDVCNITRKIIISLPGDKKCEVTDLANLQEKLLGKIKEQRVLLVLDDVWNERGDCWERLCTPLSETIVCKIIVTTRSEVVAKLVQTMPFYRIKFLSFDESWSLFKQVAFAVHQENDTPANLVEIGRSIVEKCDGLPLAIKTLASMLRYETDEMRWRHVLESQLWDLEQSRNVVLPALELSYKHMPTYVKPCFVALSLFPKDYLLSEKKVLRLWKILDLLQCDGSNNEAEIGRLYFGELVQRSFLQISFHNHTMHDLIHDLACFLAGEEFFRLEGSTPIEIPRSARYMSVLDVETSIAISIASRSLRAIIVLAEGHVKIENPEALFLGCKKLRALSLGCSNISDALPDYVGSLKLLRHLNYHESQKYPNWLGNASFYNLTEIVLHESTSQHVPTLGELPSLKFLRLKMMHCVQQIGREFCSHAPGMKGFPSLTRLEFIGLCEWAEWSGVDDGDFPCLRTLLIGGAYQLRSLPSAPFPPLDTLVLRLCWSLATVPAWPTLRELLIQGCASLNELPTLPSLLKLELVGCPNLSVIGSFPSLTTLGLDEPLPNDDILYMLLNYHPSLECVTIISYTTTCIPLDPQGLPSLRKLRLCCPNLQYCDGLAGLTSLRELEVRGCRNLPVHSLHPRQLQNLDIRDGACYFEDFDD